MQEKICRAIESDEYLEFEYDHHRRVVRPLILFKSKDERLSIGGPQVDGTSESGNMAYWRTFNLEKISSIEVVTGPSTVAGSDKVMPDTVEKYDPNSDKYEEVICAKEISEL
ncbi:hypothetical protein [Halovenus salina]|uniref:WYL domain-containing protein n=1 Tax=Halovenus salina TaxID=1510225 RepID=A0ABD5W0U4_9EURY|nr:hypothetical protein [Halovenus salina]